MSDGAGIAALVDLSASDDSMDTISFGNGVRESFEDEQDTTFGSTVTVGCCIKWLAVSCRT
jgi:hypothetical protein